MPGSIASAALYGASLSPRRPSVLCMCPMDMRSRDFLGLQPRRLLVGVERLLLAHEPCRHGSRW